MSRWGAGCARRTSMTSCGVERGLRLRRVLGRHAGGPIGQMPSISKAMAIVFGV